MTDLARCPHCGAAAELSSDDDGVAWVVCLDCAASSALWSTAAEAIAAWNRRVPNDQTEALAEWMYGRGLVTGHGNTVADLLRELDREWDERTAIPTPEPKP